MTTTAATDDLPPRRILTDDEWKKVKESFAAVGVNADTLEIQLFMPGLKWPLRDALTLIYEHSDVSESTTVLPGDATTPLELVKKQNHTIKHCNDLIAWLDDSFNYNRSADGRSIQVRSDTRHPNAGLFQFPELNDLAHTAQLYLSALVTELERCRNELMAMGASRGGHFRKTHIEFWKELARIWHDNVGKDVKQQDKYLAKFLRACSEPFFTQETIKGGAVEAFIDRYTASSK